MARIDTGLEAEFKPVIPREKKDSRMKGKDLDTFRYRLFSNEDYLSHIHGIIKNLRYEKPYEAKDLVKEYGIRETGDGRAVKTDAEIKPDVNYIGKGQMTVDEAVARFEGDEVHAVVHEKMHDIFPEVGKNDEDTIEYLTGEVLAYLYANSEDGNVRDLAYKGYLEWELKNEALKEIVGFPKKDWDGAYPMRFQKNQVHGDSYLDESLDVIGDFGNFVERNSTIPFLENYAGIRIGGVSKYVTDKAKTFNGIRRRKAAQKKAQRAEKAEREQKAEEARKPIQVKETRKLLPAP